MTNASDRLLPQDLEAEQATLGAMLTARKACVAALGIVAEADFYREAHRDIFAAIQTLHGDGEVVDPVTVAALLTRRDRIGTCGGAEYLKRLMGEFVTLARSREYARIVHDLGRLRRIISTAQGVVEAGYTHEGTPEELVREHLGKLRAIAGDSGDDRTARHTRDGVEALVERIDRQRSRGDRVSAARLGLPWIDKQLNGLAEWGMITVRGDTKVGKSLLVGNAGMATAEALAGMGDDRRVVLAYVLEAVEEWEERCIAWLARIDKRKLEGRMSMTEEEKEREETALAKWASLPLYYTGQLSHVDEILLDIEEQVMRGREPALIIVDHFQRVIGDGETATLRYDDAARKFAQIPREYGCPLLIPSQISVVNGTRQSMWCRRLDQEATVVFDIEGERDGEERTLQPTLPRKFVPFSQASYYIGSNFDARLWDEPTWSMMQGGGGRG